MKNRFLYKKIIFLTLIFLLRPLYSEDLIKTEIPQIELLIDGQQAFPEILSCIKNAETSILINMFIWRDDEIGNKIAEAILEAAERGVKITISKDTYGAVCEYAEETQASFFHKELSVTEKIKVAGLKTLYPPKNSHKTPVIKSDLYNQILNHTNIKVDAQNFKADHSKYYIFDEEILIMGGINIEDKENGQDFEGRIYQDYMIKLTGKTYVKQFFKSQIIPIEQRLAEMEDELYFGLNYKNTKNHFEMEQLYLNLINSSYEDLTIVMAYFSPLNNFIKAITNASKRGVNVRIIIPQKANYQDDSNKSTVKKLMKKSKNSINIYLSQKMLHTKLIYNEDYISFGSCNITKKAFKQLDELNIFIPNTTDEDSIYYETVIKLKENVEKTIEESTEIESYKEIKFNPIMSFLEGFVV